MEDLMPLMVKFVMAPTLDRVSIEIRQQFVGLEVPLNQLERVGYLRTRKGSKDLGGSGEYTLHPDYIVIVTKDLLLAAYRRERYLLAAYLETQYLDKLVLQRSLVSVF